MQFKWYTLLAFHFLIAGALHAQTVTGIAAQYHDGQIFLTWNNIPGADTGFYYVYKNSVPITASNIQSSLYLGRIPHNFSYDFRFTYSSTDHVPRFLVINDNPRELLHPSQNVFVMNCTQENATTYFAVRCDYGKTLPNWSVIPGANSIEDGFGIKQHLDPVKAYLQEANVIYPGSGNGEKMDVYIHYGSNIAVNGYPDMANEGCLAFHFGIIKSGPVGGSNLCLLKFHGGNGNFISNAITSVIPNSWKVSFDDWIPNYNLGESGYNTRWLGYHENFDVYNASGESANPVSGSVRAYTYRRVKWETDWIISNWPSAIDLSRIYLVGASQGCAGVWIHSIIDPWKFAAGNATDGKLNMNAPNDDNPECKYNDTSQARLITRVLWGNEDSVNLITDVPKITDATKFYKIYELTNMGGMLKTLKNYSLPFLAAINGKEDAATCWEEKVDFYNAVNKQKSGGRYYWDLRGHSGGNTMWPPLAVPGMERYESDISYPAFSNFGLNGDPGDETNPNPPYYDGDDVGAINGNVDWVDSTLVDNSSTWQADLFIFQVELNDGSLFPVSLPANVKADVTIRRAQLFKNFPDGTKLCWKNKHSNTTQSGTVTVDYAGNIMKPITMKGVKIYADKSHLKIEICEEKFGTLPAPAAEDKDVFIYPNPSTDHFNISFQVPESSTVQIGCYGLLGKKLYSVYKGILSEGRHIIPIDANQLPSGIYFVRITIDGKETVGKVIKL